MVETRGDGPPRRSAPARVHTRSQPIDGVEVLMDRRAGRRSRWAWLAAALALALVAPAGAQAATKPDVTTGGASLVTFSSARVSGSLNPNGAATTYFFQFGTTTLYGGQTPETSAGAGTKRVPEIADLGGLAPDTKYHYRLVARNAKGLTKGADRTFRTKPQPLGVSLSANPNPVLFENPTVLGGQLTGTDNGGRQVVLQANPYPYTQGFQPVGNPQVTDANGNFSFPLLSVPLNTQYRVQMPNKPAVVSPIVPVGVAPRMRTWVSATRVSRGKRVRFHGIVRPRRDGGQIAIQKFKHNGWVTITGTILKARDDASSKWSRRVRIVHSGSYRVFTGGPDDAYTSATSRTVHIKVRHR
jgi:hypothetical protein